MLLSQLTNEGASQLLLDVEAEQCRRSLGRFIRDAWHVLEPRTAYVHGWHIDAICEHLEAVTAGQILRLLVNVPFRTMKSLGVCVFWPAWVWARTPGAQWLTASGELKLASRDSRKMRLLVTSQWYRERFPDGTQIVSDQAAKTWFENEAGGHRLATTVAGAGIGHGGDYLIFDDPHKAQRAEIESELRREAVLDWWDEVFSTRLNDPETGRVVGVMHRLHESDLAGHVLEQGGWEHLMIPMEYDPKRSQVTTLGWKDPRTEPDELMWPERFSRDVVDRLKHVLGPYGTAGQLQQEPAPREGGQFERRWFVSQERPLLELGDVPGGCEWACYWDKAGTAGGGAYTAGVLMAYHQPTNIAYIRDIVRGQWAAPQRERNIESSCALWAQWLGGPLNFRVVVEQEPGSGGKDSVEDTMRRLAGYRVERDLPGQRGSKDVRAEPLATAAEVGQVRLVKGEWNEEFLREIEHFGPGASYKDQVDAAAGAYNTLAALPTEDAFYEEIYEGGVI